MKELDLIEEIADAAHRADADPGAFTPRGEEWTEAMGAWQARARKIALAQFRAWLAPFQTVDPEPLPPFEVRAESVLARTFRGIHNVPGKIKKVDPPHPYWEVHVRVPFATFDFNNLTEMVMAAHEHCVRVEIRGSGPRQLCLLLHPRKARVGTMFERHPTIGQALRDYAR